ncbi:uncharacterized protein LOC134678652 [Cydia fagiglandana]|uniref:uncharacterized protein LOC134678652 n=1 Tax=Cydia fagiglandana TaxID=1458189 RepID=UPI002FEE34BD
MSNFTFSELAIIAIILDNENERNSRKRRYWVHDMLRQRKSEGEYWNIRKRLLDDEEKFYIYFRMPRYLFYYVLNIIEDDIYKRNTRFREAVSPEEKLAVTLRYLISGCSFRTMSSSFRLGESTIRSILKDVCNAIINTMKGKFMPTPTTEDWKIIADGFNKKWNFPNCIGAIDGKHVNIIAPPSSGSLFFNYKKHFSIVLMAIVDDRYRFIAVDIGAYGRNSDGGILASSRLGRAIEMNTFNIPTDTPLPGTEIIMPHVFVADEAFPLKRNLLRPYPRSSGISEKERIYNNRLSRARRVVENAFGILYQKFGIYNKNLHLHPKYVDIVVFATCILHNVMRCYNITSDDEVNTRQSSANNDDEQRLLSTLPEDISESSASAFETRDMFATYFQSPKGRVPWQHLI